MLPIFLTEILKDEINLFCRRFFLGVWHLQTLLDSCGMENILHRVTVLKYYPLSMRDFFKVYSQFISPTQPMERSERNMLWRLMFLVWLEGIIRGILPVLTPYSREQLLAIECVWKRKHGNSNWFHHLVL